MSQDFEFDHSVPVRDETAFRIHPGSLARGLVLVCDHACNALPPGYGTLGLPPSELERHIAYDIGALGVASAMSERLGTPLIRTKFSRLLIDPNRAEDDPTLIMQLSDGAIVPGNRNLDSVEREHRLESFYRPYHRALEEMIEQAARKGIVPMLLSIHSFTDRWKTTDRPWHVTVLWDSDPRLPHPLMRELSAEPDLVVGENVPYTGSLDGDCMNRHGTRNGLAHALIEIRQDLISSMEGQKAWAKRLSAIMEKLLGDDRLMAEIGERRRYPQLTPIETA